MPPRSTLTDLDGRCATPSPLRPSQGTAPLARSSWPLGSARCGRVTRHAEARAMLADPRFELNADELPAAGRARADCLPYLRTMQEMDGPEHVRLRRLVAPAFTARRAASSGRASRPIVDRCCTPCPLQRAGRPGAALRPPAADGSDLRAGRHPRQPTGRAGGSTAPPSRQARPGVRRRRSRPSSRAPRRRSAPSAEPADDLLRPRRRRATGRDRTGHARLAPRAGRSDPGPG